jgi:hypothetical protein
MTWFTLAMASLIPLSLATYLFLGDMSAAQPLLTAFLFGFIATPWIANYLAGATVQH